MLNNPKLDDGSDRFKLGVDMPRQDLSGWILEIKDCLHEKEIDILVNRTAEMKNSELLCAYIAIDDRLEKVARVLRGWNRSYKRSPMEKLNNFSLVLALIAYMQSEKMLPNLQANAVLQPDLLKSEIIVKDKPDFREPLIDVVNVGFESGLEVANKLFAAGLLKKGPYMLDLSEGNPKTPGEILISFLQVLIDKSELDCCIEVVFDPSQTLHQREVKETLMDVYYSGKSIVNRQKTLKAIHKNYKDNVYVSDSKVRKLVDLRLFRADHHGFMMRNDIPAAYAIIDPFSRTYNPAKTLGDQMSGSAHRYRIALQKYLKELKTEFDFSTI